MLHAKPRVAPAVDEEDSPAEAVGALMVQFLSWIDARPRSYDEAMEAWRSTCPRHTIWEDALADRLIQVGGQRDSVRVTLTGRGRAILSAHMRR
jgi:hypothetical protein